MSTSPESTKSSVAGPPWLTWMICVLLGILTLAVFGQTVHFEFVNFDDIYYVYENPLVTNGLTLHGMGQAFAHGSPANWDPLTTISHMADCQLYGSHAGGHHLTNVLLHTASVILLFLVLHRMTGALWCSAIVAALFAVHPLRAESVAWVTERKDVLSGLFFMLTLGAYVRYARHPWRLSNYLLVLFFFVLGLMSKAMLVTLPFLLLLLDYWPLNRFAAAQSGMMRRVILEKLPMLGLSAVSLVVTILAQGKAVQSLAKFPFSARAGNAAISCITYVWQMVYPMHLAVYYPFPAGGVPMGKVALALAGLCAVSMAAFVWRRQHPYFLVGWVWYLGTLMPVIGLLQLGTQAHADRYTYLPQIGLYVALVWLVERLSARRLSKSVLIAAAGTVLALFSVIAANQTTYWRNSERLWKRALDCTSDSALAHYNFAMTIAPDGRAAEAISEYQTALKIQPDYANARNNLGNLLAQQGRMDEAIVQFQQALQGQPADAMLHYNLGAALASRGQTDEAINQFRQALALQPNDAEAHDTLGNLLLQSGRRNEAISHFRQALEIQPDFTSSQDHLARVAWIMATQPDDSQRNGPLAVELAELVSRSSGGNKPEHLAILAAAQAETGKFADAISNAQRALQLATAQSNAALTSALQVQLSYYRSNRPYRQPGQPNSGAAN